MYSTRFDGKWKTKTLDDLDHAYLEDEIKRHQDKKKKEEFLLRLQYEKIKRKECIYDSI